MSCKASRKSFRKKWNTISVNPALRYQTQDIYLVMHDLSNNEKEKSCSTHRALFASCLKKPSNLGYLIKSGKKQKQRYL